MKAECIYAFDNGERLEGGIHTAVAAWCADRDAAKSQYGPIASWDTSEVTNMMGLLLNQANFNGDISRWDVSSVRSMLQMFEGATSFNRDLSQWVVSKVSSMSYMLSRATSFNGDLSQWNVSNVAHMEGMLNGATSFTHQLNGAWSTSTAAKYMTLANCPGSIVGKTKDAYGTIR